MSHERGRISKCEVTNAQYAEFLNAMAATDTYELYNTHMDTGYGVVTRGGGRTASHGLALSLS